MALFFPYHKVTDFPRHQKRERFLPWLRFGIFDPKDETKVVYPLGLVDSGSDITIIDHEFGEELGFGLEETRKDQKRVVVGVGGGKIEVCLYEVGFLLDNGSGAKPIRYTDLVGFSRTDFPPSMPQQTAILGTTGFFRKLRVTFNFPKYILVEPLR